MRKITTIDRQTIRALHNELDRLLKAWADRYELDLEMKPGAFSAIAGEFRFDVTVRDDGTGVSGAQAQWNLHCYRFDLEPTDFGMRFTLRGTEYEIVGLNPTRPKFCVAVKRLRDGTLMAVDQRTVLNYRPKVRSAA